MNEIRLRKICEESLVSQGVSVSDFKIVPTQMFDPEKGDWVPHSYSLFIQVTKNGESICKLEEVENFLESFLGFECCVDFK